MSAKSMLRIGYCWGAPGTRLEQLREQRARFGISHWVFVEQGFSLLNPSTASRAQTLERYFTGLRDARDAETGEHGPRKLTVGYPTLADYLECEHAEDPLCGEYSDCLDRVSAWRSRISAHPNALLVTEDDQAVYVLDGEPPVTLQAWNTHVHPTRAESRHRFDLLVCAHQLASCRDEQIPNDVVRHQPDLLPLIRQRLVALDRYRVVMTPTPSTSLNQARRFPMGQTEILNLGPQLNASSELDSVLFLVDLLGGQLAGLEGIPLKEATNPRLMFAPRTPSAPRPAVTPPPPTHQPQASPVPETPMAPPSPATPGPPAPAGDSMAAAVSELANSLAPLPQLLEALARPPANPGKPPPRPPPAGPEAWPTPTPLDLATQTADQSRSQQAMMALLLSLVSELAGVLQRATTTLNHGWQQPPAPPAAPHAATPPPSEEIPSQLGQLAQSLQTALQHLRSPRR